jgi:cell division protein FtsI/penicillin-binding protein 2
MENLCNKRKVGNNEIHKILTEIQEKEKRNNGFLSLVMLFSQVITAEHDDTACGSWYAIAHEVQGEEFNGKEPYSLIPKILNPKTGALLGMSSRPTFNPADFRDVP